MKINERFEAFVAVTVQQGCQTRCQTRCLQVMTWLEQSGWVILSLCLYQDMTAVLLGR